jgi:Flp pilus assembly protein TadB
VGFLKVYSMAKNRKASSKSKKMKTSTKANSKVNSKRSSKGSAKKSTKALSRKKPDLLSTLSTDALRRSYAMDAIFFILLVIAMAATEFFGLWDIIVSKF